MEAYMAVNKNEILKERTKNSTKMSDMARYVCFGLLAVYYSLLTSTSDFASKVISSNLTSLHTLAILSVGAIILDYLQYWCGEINAKNSLANPLIDDAGNESYVFKNDAFKKMRRYFFWGKQILTFIGVGILVFTILVNSPIATK